MPSQKQARVSKAQDKLAVYKTELATKQVVLAAEKSNLTTSKSKLSKALKAFNDAKSALIEAKREKKQNVSAYLNINSAVSFLQNHVKTLEMDIGLIINELDKAPEKVTKKMKKGTFTDPLLQKVNLLPEVLVDMIKEFIGFDVRISILEFTTSTRKLLSRCSAPLKHDILYSFCRKRQFLSLLPDEEAIKHIGYMHSHYEYARTAKDAEVKIINLIEMAKTSNPKYAYEMLKKLHILVDPAKKYISRKRAWNNNPFSLLTQEDFDNRHVA